jgi:Cu+-exporting ATPase
MTQPIDQNANQQQITIPVSGMTCNGCRSNVEKALESAPGVIECSVNLGLKQADVTYDPSVVTPEQLVEAIRERGYDATLPPSA